jgi:hypothetical protein
MNKKAVGMIGGIFLFIFFIIVWILVLANWFSEIGQDAITTNQLTGFYAFFYANLNLWIFIGMSTALIVWGAISTTQ